MDACCIPPVFHFILVIEGVADPVHAFPAKPLWKHFSIIFRNGVQVQGVSVPQCWCNPVDGVDSEVHSIELSILIPFFFCTWELSVVLFFGAAGVIDVFLDFVTPGPKTFWVTGGWGWEEEEEEEDITINYLIKINSLLAHNL